MYDTLNGLSMAGEELDLKNLLFSAPEPGSQKQFCKVTNVNVISRTQNSSSQVGFCTVNFQVAFKLTHLVGGGEDLNRVFC